MISVLRLIVLAFFVVMLSCGCRNTEESFDVQSLENQDMAKIAPELKKRLRESCSESTSPDRIRLLGRYAGVGEDELRLRVSELGGVVHTVTASVFTAECPVNGIIGLARWEAIKYLDLPKKARLRNH